MKYPKEYLDEIKTRLKVSTVVSKSVALKKRGKEYVGLSPFKTEKTPSFTVNDDKGFFHCFSTSEHGNIFDFLMKTANMKFGEAVKTLAVEAGLPIYKFSKLDEEREKKWQTYSKILEKYKSFYHNELKNVKSKELESYLLKRGLTDKEINHFKIGFVSRKSVFFEKLKNDFSESDIFKALSNICRSRSKYLMTTHFHKHRYNRSIRTGMWRRLNLTIGPFNLPDPIEMIYEGCPEAASFFYKKFQVIWEIDTIKKL